MKDPNRFLNQIACAKLVRLTIVLVGLVAGQFILYGPSLSGQKVLLPLDILAQPHFYIPNTVESPNSYAHDPIRSDLMLQFEPDRRFAASELKQGRFPFWTPGQYGGVPFIWPKYSPFFFLTCLTESPNLIAGAGVGGARGRTGRLVFCALCPAGWFLACNPDCLVLPDDRVFYPLAGISHLRGRVLAALVACGHR